MFGQKNKSRPERYRNERTKERLNYSVRYDKIMVIHSSVIKCVCVCLAAIIMNNNNNNKTTTIIIKQERKATTTYSTRFDLSHLSLSLYSYLSISIYICLFCTTTCYFSAIQKQDKEQML